MKAIPVTSALHASHPERVCQNFRPPAVGVRGDADKELPPGEEDVAALQRGPSGARLLSPHLHHGQAQL